MTTLTMADAGAIAEVLWMAESNAKVKWLREDGSVAEGQARAITDTNGDFYSGSADVRDACLWVSTSVTELYIPIKWVMTLIQRHEFVRDLAGLSR